ncbi:MAG TPA: tetratricopeptide repeat protein, partial [Bryobacteraceae bacterium]
MHEADGVNANQRCCRERPSRCGTARLGAMRLFALAALVFAPPASAVILNYHGKVVMEDGSPPGRRVGVQRNCPGTVDAVREANASAKTGVYFVHLYIEDSSNFYVTGWQRSTTLLACYLEAVLPGYTSTRINLGDWRITRNPQLPNIVLSRQRRGALVEVGPGLSVPRSARKPWAQALKELNARNWTGAETSLRTVVAKAPDFASAWAALGGVYQNQNKPAEARTALGRAIELEPKRLPPYLSLTTVQIALKDWEAAVRTSDALIQADTEHDYLGAYLANAVARYQKQDFDGALGRMNELVELDKQHSISRADYVLGVILEARGDLDAAARHLRQYVDEHPRAPDAAAARERIANLSKESAADLSGEMAAEDRWIGTTGEAAVPGGIKAFSAIAQMRTTPDYQDFFLQYCRAIIEGGPSGTNPTREASNAIRAFIYSVGELERLGERSGGKTVIRLAVDTEEHRAKTESVLTLLGWRLLQSGGGYAVEPGDQTVDGLRQRIPAALGIDELRMCDAIAGGRPFQFEIPIESARLVGGAAWTATLKPGTEAGSPVETFLRDW